jgi:hypothetical protein
MFDTFADSTAMGTMVVDRAAPHRLDQRRLQAASCPRWATRGDFVGRRVEEVVPNTLMAQSSTPGSRSWSTC